MEIQAAGSGMTFEQIFRKTPSDRIAKAESIKITSVKQGVSKASGNPKILSNTTSVDRTLTTRVKYTTTLEVLPKSKVLVSCSCDDFLHRWEYALSKKGSARVSYGNGEPPVKTNPRLVPGACKHVIALGFLAKERGML